MESEDCEVADDNEERSGGVANPKIKESGGGSFKLMKDGNFKQRCIVNSIKNLVVNNMTSKKESPTFF